MRSKSAWLATAGLTVFLLGTITQSSMRSAISAPVADDGGILVYFSPNGGGAEAIIEQVRETRRSLDVAAFTITHSQIARSIVEAKGRGVRVRVLLDGSQSTQQYSSATFLHNAGVDVRTWQGEGSMHHKAMIVDGQVLICGSFNFTRAADRQNAENLLIVRNRRVMTTAFAREYEKLWTESVPYQRKQ